MPDRPHPSPLYPDGNGPAALLPDFCSVRILLFVVLTTELMALAISLAADALDGGFLMGLGLRSLYGQWLALTGSLLLCRLRPWLTRRFGAAGQSGAVLLLVALLSLALSGGAHWYLQPPEPATWFMLRFLATSLILAGLLLRYLYVQYLQRLQAEAEARARFQALQSRIRPHFLFNSMNTIAGLTRTHPALAEEVVQDLAELFRASLSDGDRLSTLGEELQLARHYLNIEGLRLAERLRLEWQADDLPEELPMPRLTLQPLLENAIYHGIEKRVEGGLIQFRGELRGDRLILELANPLPEQADAPTAGARQRHGMALDNVRHRLGALYGEGFLLTTHGAAGRFSVRLEIPIHDHAHPDRR